MIMLIWKGKELHNHIDLMKNGIEKCDSKVEAQEFMKLYRAENPGANENIGYLSGYYSKEEKHRIQDWFDVEHPIFGKNDPTPDEAFRAGMEWAQRVKNNQ
jgi:hypothetical protein